MVENYWDDIFYITDRASIVRRPKISLCLDRDQLLPGLGGGAHGPGVRVGHGARHVLSGGSEVGVLLERQILESHGHAVDGWSREPRSVIILVAAQSRGRVDESEDNKEKFRIIRIVYSVMIDRNGYTWSLTQGGSGLLET